MFMFEGSIIFKIKIHTCFEEDPLMSAVLHVRRSDRINFCYRISGWDNT